VYESRAPIVAISDLSVSTMLLKKTSYSALFSILEDTFLASWIAIQTSSSENAVPSSFPERLKMPNTSSPTWQGIARNWESSAAPV